MWEGCDRSNLVYGLRAKELTGTFTVVNLKEPNGVCSVWYQRGHPSAALRGVRSQSVLSLRLCGDDYVYTIPAAFPCKRAWTSGDADNSHVSTCMLHIACRFTPPLHSSVISGFQPKHKCCQVSMNPRRLCRLKRSQEAQLYLRSTMRSSLP